MSIYYEGTVDIVTVKRGSVPYNVGDVISGTLTVDTSMPFGGEYEPGRADYFAGDFTAQYDFISGYTTSDGWNVSTVYDAISLLDSEQANAYNFDGFVVVDGERSHFSAPNGDYGTYDSRIQLQIEDYSTQSINGTSLEQNFILDANSPALMQGWILYSRLHVWDNHMQATSDSGNIHLKLTYLSVTTVPVPGAAILMATALGGLGLCGWRRR